MFIKPTVAIDKGWIKGIRNPSKQIQPNAIDFTLDTLFGLQAQSPVLVTEDGKTMRTTYSQPMSASGGWYLNQGVVYDGMSEMYVEVPEGVAAILYTRSTLTRNGVFLLSGLYDSGYMGHIGFTIYPVGGSIEIAAGTRVGQIAFVSAESAGTYAGGWNHAEGTHYTGEQK